MPIKKFLVISALGICAVLCSSLFYVVEARSHLQESDEVFIRAYVTTASGNSSIELELHTAEIVTATTGSFVTYTLQIDNQSEQALSNVQLINVLPDSALDQIACTAAYFPNSLLPWQLAPADACKLVETVDRIPDPLGGFTSISKTRSISWTIPVVDAGSSWVASFTAQTTGLNSDGSDTFDNVLYVNYRQGDSQHSDSTRISLRTVVPAEGHSPLSQSPTWLSSDLGGALSSDWADFDVDGDLDLALALTIGTSVYRNTNGRLALFWQNENSRSLGVRWADVDLDHYPDLIAVGATDGEKQGPSEALSQGGNFVYGYDATATLAAGRFRPTRYFTSTYQLARIETGDFTGDGIVDLIGGTNAINPACPVHLFVNDGAGTFREGPCISTSASAAIGPGDADNDNDLDLAIGQFPNQIRLLINDGTGSFTTAPSIQVDPTVQFLPYDLSWGDFDRDGFLDLAAAFPLQRETRIYRNGGIALGANEVSFGRPIVRRSSAFMSPLAIDWGDFDGDGFLDLAVADVPPVIYRFDSAANEFVRFHEIAGNAVRGQIWSIRGIDQDNNGSLELAVTDRSGPSLLFTNLRPKINRVMTPLPDQIGFSGTPGNSIAWGDFDSDGDMDLIVGAADPSSGSGALGTKLYRNESGTFLQDDIEIYQYAGSGFLGQRVALADADQNGTLELALGSREDLLLYRVNDNDNPDGRLQFPVTALAWGDADNNGQLELLAANDTNITLFQVDLSQSSPDLVFIPAWENQVSGNASSTAWGDYNRDGNLDFAVGYANGATDVYCNNGNNLFDDDTFRVVWQSDVMSTTSVAWGDANGDGWLDLALGNYNSPNRIYLNHQISLPCTVDDQTHFTHQSSDTVWASREISPTTHVAWGDVDNDGDMDMAVANEAASDQIYINEGGSWSVRWWSSEKLKTTALALGDLDGDGDLDLAVSQNGRGQNGIYINNYTVPSHLDTDYLRTMSLPQQASYLALGRPGQTANAYFYSAAEILSGPLQPTVMVPYKLYDTDGSRDSTILNVSGDPVLETRFEYSLYGDKWRAATADATFTGPVTQTKRLGTETAFPWDAQADQAIGEEVLFRITTIESGESGRTQRVVSRATSPPFRVRGTSCIWPEEPQILVQQRADVNQPWIAIENRSTATTPDFEYFIADTDVQLRFVGTVAKGTGVLQFKWQFDPAVKLNDGKVLSKIDGQIIQPLDMTEGLYNVRLTVKGEPCPTNRPRYARAAVGFGSTVPFRASTNRVFLPVAMSPGAAAPDGAGSGSIVEAEPHLPPAPIRQLTSSVDLATGAIQISWAVDAAHTDIAAYRIYRIDLRGLSAQTTSAEPAQLLATLTEAARDYVNSDGLCDMGYFVTTIRAGRESLPSTSTVYGLPCDD